MIETCIVPRIRDLGDGFQVRRALPEAARRNVGPFVFLDQMGPAEIAPGRGLDVRPHPHIGLATVTWLFEGEILHRDSLGSVQVIRPGEVNWMSAGRGIVHSERTPGEARAGGSRVFGIQTWLALPLEEEESEPAFSHHANLPVIEDTGVSLKLILGDLLGAASPVPTRSPAFYAEVTLAPGRRFAIPAKHGERGVFVVEGEIAVAARRFASGVLVVLEPGAEVLVESRDGARFMILGGAPLDAPRFVWWNFVSSRRERIDQAAADWRAGRFPPVPGDDESIPIPERGPKLANYP